MPDFKPRQFSDIKYGNVYDKYLLKYTKSLVVKYHVQKGS